MGITTGRKHKLYFSPVAPATFDATGWAALTDWELASCPETIPELVKRMEKITYACLHSGTTETARGAAQAIDFTPPIKDDPANLAQGMLKTAFEATSGTPEELVSMKVENADATQTFFAQAKVTGWGPGERTMTGVYMRIAELTIDAATLVEVQS